METTKVKEYNEYSNRYQTDDIVAKIRKEFKTIHERMNDIDRKQDDMYQMLEKMKPKDQEIFIPTPQTNPPAGTAADDPLKIMRDRTSSPPLTPATWKISETVTGQGSAGTITVGPTAQCNQSDNRSNSVT